MNRILIFLVSLLVIIGCSRDDGPSGPEAVTLIFPEQSSECTTGIDVGDNKSEVTFRWNASANTDSYTISYTNLDSGRTNQLATANTVATLTLDQGSPYAWTITSSNGAGATAVSERWLFYNAGTQVNYAPFPAQAIFPKFGEIILLNTNDTLTLQWEGADVENDIVNYEVFFSEASPDALQSVQIGLASTHTIQNLIRGNTYYWKIVTSDAQGNTSDSGVFEFKVD